MISAQGRAQEERHGASKVAYCLQVPGWTSLKSWVPPTLGALAGCLPSPRVFGKGAARHLATGLAGSQQPQA